MCVVVSAVLVSFVVRPECSATAEGHEKSRARPVRQSRAQACSTIFMMSLGGRPEGRGNSPWILVRSTLVAFQVGSGRVRGRDSWYQSSCPRTVRLRVLG